MGGSRGASPSLHVVFGVLALVLGVPLVAFGFAYFAMVASHSGLAEPGQQSEALLMFLCPFGQMVVGVLTLAFEKRGTPLRRLVGGFALAIGATTFVWIEGLALAPKLPATVTALLAVVAYVAGGALLLARRTPEGRAQERA